MTLGKSLPLPGLLCPFPTTALSISIVNSSGLEQEGEGVQGLDGNQKGKDKNQDWVEGHRDKRQNKGSYKQKGQSQVGGMGELSSMITTGCFSPESATNPELLNLFIPLLSENRCAIH